MALKRLRVRGVTEVRKNIKEVKCMKGIHKAEKVLAAKLHELYSKKKTRNASRLRVLVFMRTVENPTSADS